MAKKDTVKFYEENKEIVEMIEKHGSTEMRKIATAIKLAAEEEKLKTSG